jgi:hypothetical protein
VAVGIGLSSCLQMNYPKTALFAIGINDLTCPQRFREKRFDRE